MLWRVWHWLSGYFPSIELLKKLSVKSLIYYLPISKLPTEYFWHKIFSPKVWNKAYSKSLLVQTSNLKLFFLIESKIFKSCLVNKTVNNILFRKLGVLVNVQLKEGVKAFWKILCGIWTRPYFRFKYILERQIAAFTAWCTMGSNPFYWNIIISIQASIYTRYFSNIPTYFDRRKNWRNCCEKGCCTKCSAHLTYNIEKNSGKLWQLLKVHFLDLLVMRPSIFSKGAFTNYGLFNIFWPHTHP